MIAQNDFRLQVEESETFNVLLRKWDYRKRGAWDRRFPTVVLPVRLRDAATDLAELNADGNRSSPGSSSFAVRLR